jgi:hypothetical protein
MDSIKFHVREAIRLQTSVLRRSKMTASAEKECRNYSNGLVHKALFAKGDTLIS